MTRGDQRDRDRLARMKKEADKTKGQRSDGKSFSGAKETDAERMRQKQLAAEAKRKAQEEGQ